jgi:hypothetical protein
MAQDQILVPSHRNCNTFPPMSGSRRRSSLWGRTVTLTSNEPRPTTRPRTCPPTMRNCRSPPVAWAWIKSSLRETDFPARLGGDEFAIIQAEKRDTRKAALVCARAGACHKKHRYTEVGTATVSLMAECWPPLKVVVSFSLNNQNPEFDLARSALRSFSTKFGSLPVFFTAADQVCTTGPAAAFHSWSCASVSG